MVFYLSISANIRTTPIPHSSITHISQSYEAGYDPLFSGKLKHYPKRSNRLVKIMLSISKFPPCFSFLFYSSQKHPTPPLYPIPLTYNSALYSNSHHFLL